MDELHYLLAGGIPLLLGLILVAAFMLFLLILSVAAIISQRRHIPYYSARQVYEEYRAMQHPGAQWHIILLGAILADIFLCGLIFILRGPIFGLVFVLLFFNSFMALWVIQLYERQRFLTKRIKELEAAREPQNTASEDS